MDKIGIDFGTSTTLAAADAVAGEVIPLGRASRWMPTVASLYDGTLHIGDEADNQPEWSVIRSVKSALYRGETEITRTSPDGEVHRIEVDKVVGHILEVAAARAASALGSSFEAPVHMACPAIWHAEPRRRLAAVATSAGLDVELDRILDEPIAAGVSWVMERFRAGLSQPQGRVLVFDYGGGTLDVAVLDVAHTAPPEITVLAASGLQQAGDDLDELIAGDLAVEVANAGYDLESVDRPEELRALVRLAARRLKVALTDSEEATERIPGYDDLPTLSYTRHRLEAEFEPMLDTAIRIACATLKSAELRARNASDPSEIRRLDVTELAEEVDHVLLAGGMSRVPLVATRLGAAFPNAELSAGISGTAPGHPEEAIARGLVQPDRVVNELNLHRPGFDFVLEFSDGSRVEQHVVYSAYSPLYSPDQIMRGEAELGHRYETPVPSWTTECRLRCLGVDGTVLPFRVNDQQAQTIGIAIDQRTTVVTKLYADGRLLVKGRSVAIFRVERWPHIRSKHGAAVTLTTPTPAESLPKMLDPAGWWPLGY